MGKTDAVTKNYMKDVHRFADAFNYYLFDGEQKIKPKELKEADPTELGVIMDDAHSEIVQRYRDILKQALFLTDDNSSYLLLGIENQSEVHTAMPVKNLLYDALNYGEQVSKRNKERRRNKIESDTVEFLSGFGREDKLKPVFTLVILWKSGPWNAPRSLFEMLDLPGEWMKQYLNDYKLHIIVPDEIEDFAKFRTELGVAMEFISCYDEAEGREMMNRNPRFESVTNETVHLLNVCTGSKFELDEKEGVVDMCQWIKDMEATAMREGIREGKHEGLREGNKEGQYRVNKLNHLLLEHNRMEDLIRSIAEPEYQQQLFKEFCITE